MTATLHPFWALGTGADVLEEASRLVARFGDDTLRTLQHLRGAFPGIDHDLPARALELCLARRRALPYGEWTRHGLFTRRSVEQATAPAIARHHASRFAGCHTVLEICTGAGMDTAALAAVASRVVGIEADAELAAMARHNLAVQGIDNAEVLTGRAEDVVTTLDLATIDGVWADPSRRTDDRRITSPDDYLPPLSFINAVADTRRCGIKIAPAATLDAESWQREWIGFESECREQILWRHAPVVDNTVTLVDRRAVFMPVAGIDRRELVLPDAPETLAGRWLVEPHKAVVRSGVLHALYAEDCIALLDEHIAYGIADVRPSPSPLYTVFRICEAFSWNEKKLRRRLRDMGWGSGTEIKKRGFPLTPDQLRPRLRLPQGGPAGVILLTRVGEGHLAILAERV